MSPLELGRELAAFDQNQREQFEAQIAQVWHGVYLYAEMTRTGSLPALADHLAKMKPREVTTRPKAVAQLKNQLEFLSRDLGIPLRPISEEAKRAFVRVDG
jgi:hypothetical protein